MSNQLPKAISKRIEDEALQYAKSIPDCMPHIAYRRGATEWAGKAQVLFDAMGEINEKISHWDDERGKRVIERIIYVALAKYKEVTK
jgi:hypothetical protein